MYTKHVYKSIRMYLGRSLYFTYVYDVFTYPFYLYGYCSDRTATVHLTTWRPLASGITNRYHISRLYLRQSVVYVIFNDRVLLLIAISAVYALMFWTTTALFVKLHAYSYALLYYTYIFICIHVRRICIHSYTLHVYTLCTYTVPVFTLFYSTIHYIYIYSGLVNVLVRRIQHTSMLFSGLLLLMSLS